MKTKGHNRQGLRMGAMTAALTVSVAVCWAQQGGIGTSTPSPSLRQPNGSVSSVPPGDDPLFTLGDSLRAKRNDERQKRLENDTQKLVALANQLKSEVAASGAESMTPEMLHQMDEIEKLAKSVKDRMRS